MRKNDKVLKNTGGFMIKVFENDYEVNIDNNIDLNEILKEMEQIDDMYRQKNIEKKHFISTNSTIVFYAFNYNIELMNKDTLPLIHLIIKNWDKFDKIEQNVMLEKISKKIESNYLDDVVISWVKEKLNL